MSSRQGRNTRCRCGSGLKYKRCCLPAVESLRLLLGADAGAAPPHRSGEPAIPPGQPGDVYELIIPLGPELDPETGRGATIRAEVRRLARPPAPEAGDDWWAAILRAVTMQ